MADNNIRKQFNVSLRAYSNGEYRKSLHIAQSIYSRTPSNVDNLILLAALQFQKRNLSESLFYSQQAIRVESNCAEAYSIMGNCLKEMNDLESARNFFHKAIRFNPRFADSYQNLGLVLFLSGKPKEAIEAFEVALSLDPSHCDALCNIGAVLKVLGRYNEAKEKYLQAIRINPQCAIGWSNLGGIFVNIGDYAQAVTCYDHALKIAPNFCDALSNSANAIFKSRSRSRRRKGDSKDLDLDEALVQEVHSRYERALEQRADFVLSIGCHAIFNLENGLQSKEEVIKALRRVVLQDDTCFDAMSNLAALYFLTWRLDDSLKVLLRVLKQKPEHWCAYNNLGNVLKEKGMFAAAAFSYQICLHLNEKDPSLHSNIGALLLMQNRELESFNHFQNAIGFDPLFRSAYMNMGLAYLSVGKMDNAEQMLNESRGGFKSLYNLAVLKQREGDLDGALHFIKLAMDECVSEPEPHRLLATKLLGFIKISMCEWSEFDPIDHISLLNEFYDDETNTGINKLNPSVCTEETPLSHSDDDTSRVDLRSQLGISDDVFLYACFNHPYEIDLEIFEAWIRILEKTDSTCLLLIRHNEQMERNLNAMTKKRGVKPERLIFIDDATHKELFKRYSIIDLYLDTSLRSGRAEIRQALRSGSPVICIQETSGYVSSILSYLELEQLTVQSLVEYEELAISLHSNEGQFIEIIRKLDDKLEEGNAFFPIIS